MNVTNLNNFFMDFNELQNKMVKNLMNYGKNYKIQIDEDFALLKLYEEVGEFAQAVLVHRKKSRPEKYLTEEKAKEELGKELADIIGMTIVNAHLLEIDLEKAIIDKWIDREK